MSRAGPGMRAELGDKLDRIERRRRWRTGALIAAALAGTMIFAAVFLRPATPVGEELVTVREVRAHTVAGKGLSTSMVIEVVRDDGHVMVIADPYRKQPLPGSRLVLGKFANVFGHIDYRWDGRVATEKARAP